MAKPLPLGAQRVLAARLEALRRLDERGQLAQTRLLGRRSARQLVVPLPGGAELAPREPRLAAAAQLLLAAVGVEHVELVRGPGEPPLLELAGHRDQPLGGGGEVLARDGAAPRVGARAAVGEDAAREHEAGLVLGRELGERRRAPRPRGSPPAGRARPRRRPRRAAAPIVPASPFAPSRRPIAWARIVFPAPVSPVIAVRPGRRRELSLPHEDEVLDPQATKQRSGCSG